MPTYQSAPNYPPVFPDEIAHKNPYGFKTMKGNTILVRGETEAAHSAHPKWKQEAYELALAKVQNTKLAQEKMLKQPASRKGLHGYTTYNGSFDSVRGGTVWSKKAEEMVQGLVRDRKFQYDALNEATFDSIPQNRLGVNLPPSDTFKLDKLFLDILSNLTAGNVKPLYSEIGSLINELMMSAEKLPEAKISDYQEQVLKIIDALSVLGTEQYGLISKRNINDLKGLGNRLKRVQEFLQKLDQLRGRPTKEKASVLQSMRYSLLADSQQLLQEGALGLYPGVEEARIAREEQFQEGMPGRPAVRRRRRAVAAESEAVQALQGRLGVPVGYEFAPEVAAE